MFRYETHLHTSPVSKCATASVEKVLKFYKENGYDGIFITNHFLDGNINIDRSLPYAQRLDFYFSDYERAKKSSSAIGIKVFCGVEISYGGTDFLIYGLDKNWFLLHPEYESLRMKEKLELMHENGAFIVHAHPFREADYIDHIRLFPRSVDGIEVINACRTELENKMARIYADNYGFSITAGSDNHHCGDRAPLAGVQTEKPIDSVEDYIRAVRERQAELFTLTAKSK